MDNESRSTWFALQVWAGREHLSARHLQLRGYETFLPCCRERRQWSDRVKTIERPLFSGYLFCRLHANFAAQMITAPAVIRIIGGSDGPIPVPEQEIESVRRIVDSDFPVVECPIPIGQTIRIEHGPLKGVQGTVKKLKNSVRVVVEITLLQRAVATEVSWEWISNSALGR